MTRRNEPIASWESGDEVQGFALLSRKEARNDRNGNPFLDVELTDASGSMPGRVWSSSRALEGDYEAHDFVAFKGTVKLYRDALQISLEDCRRAADEDRRHGFDEALLIPSTHEDIDELWQRLEALFSRNLEQPPLVELARQALALYGDALREHPAAKSIHHAYRGGLLEHVVSMGELAEKVCDHYREVDRELVILGVLFHDLGKIRELGAMPANDYTLEGRLVGHTVIGRDLLLEASAQVPGFPPDLRLLLEHLVLSHQGKKEFAAPVEPMTAEAFVLHYIDDLDAKLNQLRVLAERATGTQYVKSLGRYVFLGEEGEEDDGDAGRRLGVSARPATLTETAGGAEPSPRPAPSPQGSLFATPNDDDQDGSRRG